jgi:hypothetical protein
MISKINVRAEDEIEVILLHLEYQNEILIFVLQKLGFDPEDAGGKAAP